MGLGVGYFVHTLAACLGLSAIILSSALAFSIIKWLGAAYLLYLGFMSLKSMWKGQSKLAESNRSKLESNVFKQGVVVSVLNPKVALFFLSFLPQFIDVSSGDTNIQLLILGLLFSVLATLCNVIYAVSGFLLVGLAGKIALSK